MNVGPTSGEVDRFRGLIERHLGLNFDDGKCEFLANVLRHRLEETREGVAVYLGRLAQQASRTEIGSLAKLLTVSETYFFRHYDQYRAFTEVALANWVRTRKEGRRLSILSAGCASGEEAYSLAMIVRDAGVASRDVAVLGADVNPAALEKAARGCYSTWALRETPADMLRRWFQPQGRDYVLDESIRSAVRFEERNLADEDLEFWRPGSYDIVFCRNMLMYLSAERARALVARITGALAPGGYLFLGHAETLRGLSQDFHLCHTHEAFYYRRRAHGEAGEVTFDEFSAPAAPLPVMPATANAGDDHWIQAIHSSAQRIESLAQTPASAVRSSPVSDTPRWNLGQAFELLRRERFLDALNAVQDLPPEARNDADALLLKAALCAHSGQLDEAGRVCRQLLESDELNAGAHYVLALCHEAAGDRGAAVSHDQTAVYLDPTFAMPRLHLGLLALRGSDQETARRELEQAMLLLRVEEPSRLLLFGGGFGREALLALCRAELRAGGGRA